jgi:N-acetylmuramoyl-L-alanine amidase
MNKLLTIFLCLTLTGGAAILFINKPPASEVTTGAPPYVAEDLQPPPTDHYSWLRNWQRPDGPARVGLQVGHWQNDQLPEELERLRGNTGSSGGGKSEWQVNLAIAEHTQALLQAADIEVDILSATIPPSYWADVFVAIHADGSLDPDTTGFKLAHPRRDYTGQADQLLNQIEASYQSATNLTVDPNVSRNMRGYYAFAWWRYTHAVHPMTTSVILETGFLTSPHDRTIIVSQPERAAQGLATGIINYLQDQDLLPNETSK